MTQAQELALTFADCFYLDEFGQVGLRFRDLRFVPIYEEINTVVGAKYIRHRFEPDNLRKFLIFSVLMGIALDTVEWSISEQGDLKVTKLNMPAKLYIPRGDEGSSLSYIKPYGEDTVIPLEHMIPQDSAMAKSRAQIAVRSWLEEKFGYADIYKEITDIYKTIDKVLWHNNIQNEA
jgi:hypothetical protein